MKILKGIKDRYEKFHEVRYSDEVVEAFVGLSNRYIQDRFLPDKAIDLMDEVGSRLNLANAQKDSDSLQERLDEVVKQKQEAAEKKNMSVLQISVIKKSNYKNNWKKLKTARKHWM